MPIFFLHFSNCRYFFEVCQYNFDVVWFIFKRGLWSGEGKSYAGTVLCIFNVVGFQVLLSVSQFTLVVVEWVFPLLHYSFLLPFLGGFSRHYHHPCHRSCEQLHFGESLVISQFFHLLFCVRTALKIAFHTKKLKQV